MEEIDWSAFMEGWQAWNRQIDSGNKELNPYATETLLWMSWNRGKNLNTKGVLNDLDWCESCGNRNCIC